MHQFAVFYFQLILWSIEMYDQPVCTLVSVIVTTIVQVNVNNRLKTYNKEELFLILKFHYVVNVVFFLSGDSLASVFCVPTFQNTLSLSKRHQTKFRCWVITQK